MEEHTASPIFLINAQSSIRNRKPVVVRTSHGRVFVQATENRCQLFFVAIKFCDQDPKIGIVHQDATPFLCHQVTSQSAFIPKRTFGTYWFETGTPTFLIETLFNRRVSSLELDNMIGGEELLSTFDVDDMATEALLFQTGYLTITEQEDLSGESLYRLSYPNREVRQSLNRSLLRYLVKDSTRQKAIRVSSGDHAGERSVSLLCVKRTGPTLLP